MISPNLASKGIEFNDASSSLSQALSSETVKQFIEGKTVKKVIIVPKKMVNIVVA